MYSLSQLLGLLNFGESDEKINDDLAGNCINKRYRRRRYFWRNFKRRSAATVAITATRNVS